MAKERTTVSLDEAVAEQVRDDDVDFSPLVNRWAREYYEEGRRPVMSRTRLQRMLDDLDRQEARFERFVADMRDTFDAHRQLLVEAMGDAPDEDDVLRREIETVYNQLTVLGDDGTVLDRTPRDPDNPAVRNHARRVGIAPEHLVDELRRRDRRDGRNTPGSDADQDGADEGRNTGGND